MMAIEVEAVVEVEVAIEAVVGLEELYQHCQFFFLEHHFLSV